MILQSGDLAAESRHYDVVIVGGGTCGSVLASRLSEDATRSVCLFEAGPVLQDPAIDDPAQWPQLQGREFDWKYRTVAQPNTAGRSHDWPRGKLLGGSSCINAMAHVRGHPADFQRWLDQGCQGWGFQDLLPYYIRSETSGFDDPAMHGKDGPVFLSTPAAPHPITKAYMAAGVEQGLTPIEEHNGAEMAGPTLNTLTIQNGKRQTTSDAYLPTDVLNRVNLHVMPDAQVLKLKLDQGGQCQSLLVRQSNGASFEYRSDAQVVLCAGAIETPALLLRSGVGPAAALHLLEIEVVLDHPEVGQNLQDHLLAGGNVYHARNQIEPSRYQHSESLMYIHDGSPDGAPDIVLACVIAPVTTDQFVPPDSGEAFTIMYGFTHPESRGAVTLQSADPDVMPRIDPMYLSAPPDREMYLKALRWARRIGGSDALAPWRSGEYLPQSADLVDRAALMAFLGRAAFTHHHPAGTCRMGGDVNAVVDPSLRLNGTENIYITDASVMPCLTTGPINATLIAMAERASDLFADKPPLRNVR